MLTDQGIVKSIHDKTLTIEAQVKSTCSGCNVRHSCGSGLVARAFASKSQVIQLASGGDFKPGDKVSFGVEPSAIVRASFWVYLVPIFACLLGAIVFSWVQHMTFDYEIVTILGSGLAGFVGFKIAQRTLSRAENAIQIHLVDE